MNRMKFYFLSLCAIAALASCSLSEDMSPASPPKGAEAKVIFTLEGGKAETKSNGIPVLTELDKSNGKISNFTVFIFSKDGNLITKKHFGSPATGANAVNTTTDAHEISVIANTGTTDPTTGTGPFVPVSSKTELQNVLGNLVTSGATGVDATLTQSDENLYMSGTDTVSAFKVSQTGAKVMAATASVKLSYIPARILLTKITYNGGTVTTNKFLPSGSFANDQTGNFTIERVYLMNVQSASRFIPLQKQDKTFSYIEQAAKIFSGGVAWNAPWEATLKPTGFMPNNGYAIEGNLISAGTTANVIADIGHWYVFENTGVSELANHPTVLVIKVNWRKRKADSTKNPAVTEELTSYYFTVYFGGNDQDEIKAGKSYDVTVALNGDFSPSDQGGNGGGGTTTPDKPTSNSSVSVTVTPASWPTAVEINKTFN